MQHPQSSITIGTIVQKHYIVEDLLGSGGFSVVYLVRDLHHVNGEEQRTDPALFALKELVDQNEHERQRFTFEGEVLQRLSHPSLPAIQLVFEDKQNRRSFILMEYIQGPSLETKRREQSDRRFSPALVLTMMKPIMEAVAYLHSQQPCIIHRDIKPANIIAPETGDRAVLVDFGIAKEYDPEATTTAVRHCSPGYSAPEQYSSLGTDPRTDIYGFAATCYTLLTGVVPADALNRVTSLASKRRDPLIPIGELVPDLSTSVAQAIDQSLSIRIEDRFSTIEEFWQALQSDCVKQTDPLISAQWPHLAKATDVAFTLTPRRPGKPTVRKRSMFATLSLVSLLLLVLGAGLGFGAYTAGYLRPFAPTAALTPHVHRSISATSTSDAKTYTILVSTYTGTMHDLLTRATTKMSLTKLRQHNETMNGTFTGLNLTGSFKGVLDSSRHIFFTVTISGSPKTLFFEGVVRPDHNLAGNFCNLDQGGQCISEYGLWSVAPGP